MLIVKILKQDSLKRPLLEALELIASRASQELGVKFFNF